MRNLNKATNVSDSLKVAELGSAGAIFKQLETEREPYLEKAKLMASLSLPYVCPPDEGQYFTTRTTRQELPVPKNGVTAQGVKNLSSKLVTTLFPNHIPYFRFSISEAVLNEADELEKASGGGQQYDEQGVLVQTGGSFRSEIQQRLLSYEKTITERTELYAHRRTLYELMKRLIITGNCLLRYLDDGSLRTFNLGNYVVERDYAGKPYRIILKEMKRLDLLTPEVRSQVLAVHEELKDKADAEVTLYTYWGVQSTSNLWESWQEVTDTGIVLPDSYGTFKFEELPVMAERWIATDGENYGRSLLEEHESDVVDLESLTADVKDLSKANAKVIPLINPNGITDAQDLAEAENLEFVEGLEEDVKPVTMASALSEIRSANEMRMEITQRLQEVFLMFQSVQRDAERLTATEIRYMAGQLEQAHGGVYTVLADELQRPYVNRMIQQAILEGDLPNDIFNDGQIQPQVITGLDALGRGQDADSMRELFAMIRENQGQREFHMAELWTRYLVSVGIELDGLMKTPQDKVEEQNQAQAIQRRDNQQAVGSQMALDANQAQVNAQAQTQPPQ